MNKPIVLVDVFKDIVEATENAINDNTGLTLLDQLKFVDQLIDGVHYQHGHPLEIIETLQQQSEARTTKTSRFPLIALFQDFPESIDVQEGFYGDVPFHLIIARPTDPNYKAGKRYEVNFKPILYPIYQAFMEQIRLSRRFSLIDNKIPHTKIDRLYWGREGLYGNDGNVFNDRIDCIEIRDLKLRVKTQNC